MAANTGEVGTTSESGVSGPTPKPTVFISYSHDGPNHLQRVLELSEALRREGIDAVLDRYVNGTPPQGWPRWTLDQIDRADFVLLICTPTYYGRFRGHKIGAGKGANWEGSIITQEIYERQGITGKFVPILLASSDANSVPEPVRGYTFYDLSSNDAFAKLVEFVFGVAGIEPAPIGEGQRRERARAGGRSQTVLAGSRRDPNDSEPTYDSDETRALALRLGDARRRASALRAAGADATAADREILELRRQLRLGGQLRAGDHLSDRYLLLECLGRGGFGTVWKALDSGRGVQVAVKVLHPDQARDLSRRERFFRGARVMAELQHEGIVRVLDPHCEDDGYFYFVMEVVDGPNLHRAVTQGQITRAKAILLVLDVGRALVHAHRRNVIHRDVKPANILLEATGRAKLTDFDLVKADDTTGGTRTGAMGTYLFAAPEQLQQAGQVDARADVYGLAMTAIFCLHSGDLPSYMLREPAVVIDRLECSLALKRVLARGIALNVEERLGSAQALCDALEAAQHEGSNGEGEYAVDSDGIRQIKPSFLRSIQRLGTGMGLLLGIAGLATIVIGFLRPGLIVPPVRVPASSGSADRAVVATPTMVTPSAAAVGTGPLVCPTGILAIPGGSFFMGNDEGMATEKPMHQVVLAPYCIDEFEVTVDRYKSCSDGGRCKRARITNEWDGITDKDHKVFDPLCNARDPEGRGRHPINCVDWEMAAKFCAEQGGRLPTEAEWEFAARGPDGRKYPWGDDDPSAGLMNACGKECLAWGRKNGVDEKAMYAEDDGFPNTAPVGSFPKGASRYGLQDVVGNVWEWVADWYGDYSKDEQKAPTGPADGTERVIRGGAWNGSYPSWVRPTFRTRHSPSDLSFGIGFRCVK